MRRAAGGLGDAGAYPERLGHRRRRLARRARRDAAEQAAGPAGSAIERSLAIADLAVVIEDARDDIAGLLRD